MQVSRRWLASCITKRGRRAPWLKKYPDDLRQCPSGTPEAARASQSAGKEDVPSAPNRGTGERSRPGAGRRASPEPKRTAPPGSPRRAPSRGCGEA